MRNDEASQQSGHKINADERGAIDPALCAARPTDHVSRMNEAPIEAAKTLDQLRGGVAGYLNLTAAKC